MGSFPWCQIPVVQAPVASAAGPELCVAVTNAGGIGAVSLTWRDPGTAVALIENIKGLTTGLFYANFVLHFEPRSLPVALEAGLPMVTFSFGDPAAYIPMIRAHGAKFGIQVTSRESALKMLRHHPDFLIVQGVEAGGHVQAHRSMVEGLEEVVAAAGDTPVLAAGGLATGTDLAAVMQAGAAGGVFGTRFVASIESEAHLSYKRAITAATSRDTVLTNCFDGDWPQCYHRVLRNSTFRTWEAGGCPLKALAPGMGDVVATSAAGTAIPRYDDALPRFDTVGNHEAMALYAGTSVDRVSSIQSAGEIVLEIWSEAMFQLGMTNSIGSL